MSLREPAGSNTYIPSYDATGVILAYTRDPKKFRLPQYTRSFNVTKDQGYYLSLDTAEPVRLVSENDFVWEDGADSAAGNDGKLDFEYKPYKTVRLRKGFAIGKKAVDQATWPILAQHSHSVASVMMLLRTYKTANLLTTAANWTAGGVTPQVAVGNFNRSTESDLFIQNTINNALLTIEKNTNGIGSDEDSFIIVINPNDARLIGTSDEYRNYIKGSPDALSALTDQKNPNRKYQLAPYLYGVKLVVENAVRVSTRKNTTGVAPTKNYVWPDGSMAILTKPEASLGDGNMDGADISTVAFRFYEEMTVESKSDPDNRRELGRVVEDYIVQLQAASSGMLITGLQQ